CRQRKHRVMACRLFGIGKCPGSSARSRGRRRQRISRSQMTSAKVKLFRRLKRILPGEIFLEPATLEKYAGDKWFAAHQPDAVALPRSAKSVAVILKFANQHRIPVTPRGAGHGYVGGCVPVRGGIVLSLERMNKILEINPRDFVAVVQPGVNTAEFQNRCESRRLLYPPDP